MKRKARLIGSKGTKGDEQTCCSMDDTEPRVTFSNVEIREYARLLIDHPSCPDGLAIGIDWKYQETTKIVGVDQFESLKKRKGRRQTRKVKALSLKERKNLLMKQGGYDEVELNRAFFLGA